MANLSMSDDEFDALMDNLPRSARNKVIAQLREAEGDDAPEKRKLYSKPEATQGAERAASEPGHSTPPLGSNAPQGATVGRVLWALVALTMLVVLPFAVSMTLFLTAAIVTAVVRVERRLTKDQFDTGR